MELKDRLLALGYEPGDLVLIKDLRERIRLTDPKLYKDIFAVARTINGKNSIEPALEEMGFKTLRINNIIPKLTSELKELFTLDLIASVIYNGSRFPSRRELRTGLQYLMPYENRVSKGYSHYPSLPQILDSLHPEHPHLSIYIRGKVLYSDFEPAFMKEKLLEMYYDGENISPSGLADKMDNIFGRWLSLYSNLHQPKQQKEMFSDQARKRNVTWAISHITGLRKESFSIGNAKMKKMVSTLSEYMVRVLLHTTVNHDPFAKRQTEAFRRVIPVPLLKSYPELRTDSKPRGAKIDLAEGYIFADALVVGPRGACQVEVKNYRTPNKKESELLEKRLCTDQQCTWSYDGMHRNIDSRAVVIHSLDETYERMRTFLPDSLPILSPHEFKRSLERSVEILEREGYIKTNVHSKEELLELNALLNERPDMFMRQGHEKMNEFANAVLKDVLKRLQTKTPYKSKDPITIYGNEGESVQNKHGVIQRFLLSIDDIPDEIEGNPVWTKSYVQKRLDKIPCDVRFTDVESTGFHGKMIFLIGTAYRDEGTLKYELLFARNPLEEKAMLFELCNMDDYLHYTYNGSRFDFPSMEKRIEAWMIKDELPERHIDLLSELIKARKIIPGRDLPSLKLNDVAGVFGEVRSDMDSRSVPLKYNNWLRNGRPGAIADIFEHNVLDLTNLAAIMLSPDLFGSRYYDQNILNPLRYK